ncbi:PaaI family thioesterase [Psychromonas sp.]|nr:PaaI family thioesterase [Psychromonas sp.]
MNYLEEIAKISSQAQQLKHVQSELILTPVEKRSSHQHCMLCGTQPTFGLQLNFYADQNNDIWTYTKGSIHQQGYQGILHGGFIAALLDASMCNLIFNQDEEAVTADMNIRYLAEIPMTSEMIVHAKIIKTYLSLYKVEAEVYVKDQLMAKSSARFMKRA